MGCSSSKESEVPPSVPPSGFQQQRHVPSSPSSVPSHTHPFTINIQPPTPIKDTFASNENDMQVGMSSISEERVFSERAPIAAAPHTPPKQTQLSGGGPVFQTPERIVQEQEQQLQQQQSLNQSQPANVKSDRKSQDQMEKLVTQLQQLTQSNLLLSNQLQQSNARSETLEKNLANAKKLATDPDHIALIEARRDSSPREVPMGKVTFKRMQAEVDHSNALQFVLDQTKAQLKESQEQVTSVREAHETLITRCSETQNLLFDSQKRTAELEQSNRESLAAQKNLAESLATSQREGEVSLGFITELRMHIASLESKQAAERTQAKGDLAALQSQIMQLQATLHQAERTIRDKDLQIEQLRALLHGKLHDEPPPQPSTEHLSHPIEVEKPPHTAVTETNEQTLQQIEPPSEITQPTAEQSADTSAAVVLPTDGDNVPHVTETAPEVQLIPASSIEPVSIGTLVAVEPIADLQQVEQYTAPPPEPEIQQSQPEREPAQTPITASIPVSAPVPPLSTLPLVAAASDSPVTVAAAAVPPEDAEADEEFNQWLAWKEEQRRKEREAHELESGPAVSAGHFPFSATAASTLNSNRFTATESTLPIVPDLILPTIENEPSANTALPSSERSKQNTSRRTESMESARKRVFPTRADEDEFQLWLWEKKQEEELASMIARAKTIEEQKMAAEEQRDVSPSSPLESPKSSPKSSPSPSMRDAQLNSSDAEKEFALWLRQNKASHSSKPLLEDEEKQQALLLLQSSPRNEKLTISKHAPAASWPHFNAFEDKSPSPPVMATSGRKAWNTSQDLTHTTEVKQQIFAASKQGGQSSQQVQSSSTISGLSGRRVAQQPPAAAGTAADSTAVLPTWAQQSQESKSNDYLTPANMLPPALAAKVTSGVLGVTATHHEKSSSFSYVNWQSTHAPIEGSMAIASAAQRQAQSMVNQRAQEQLISHSSSQPVLSLSPSSPGLSTRFLLPAPAGSAAEGSFILPFEPLLWLSADSFHTDAGRTLLISQMSDNAVAPMHVGGWLDSSPTANHATLCSSGGRCLFRNNVEKLNGQPCVELGGSSAMKFRQPINLCGEFFLIIVSKILGSSPYLLGGQHGVHLPVFTSGAPPNLVTRKSATRVSESKSSAMGGFSISSFARRGDSGRLTAWLHGHDVSTGNAINNEEIRIEFLGQVVDEVREAQFVSPCSIAEVLLFDRVPSDSQRSLLESYLNEKYLVYPRRKIGL